MTTIEKLESMDTLVSVDTLSKLLSTSRKTLYKAIQAGHLPAYRIGGIRLEPSEVAQWLRDRSGKK